MNIQILRCTIHISILDMKIENYWSVIFALKISIYRDRVLLEMLLTIFFLAQTMSHPISDRGETF